MKNNMINHLFKYLVKVFGFKGNVLVKEGRLWLTFGDNVLDVGPLAIGEEALAARAAAELPVHWTDELDD